jgi:hypothetical protein
MEKLGISLNLPEMWARASRVPAVVKAQQDPQAD